MTIQRVTRRPLPIIDRATGRWGSARTSRLIPILETPGRYLGVRAER